MKDGDTIAGEPKPVAPGKPKPKKKRKEDAMFMGLGDIIFRNASSIRYAIFRRK